jgi:hypothetical protein
MADIICPECKSEVSDASEFCTECGFPFENMPTAPAITVAEPISPVPRAVVDTPVNSLPDVPVVDISAISQPETSVVDDVASVEDDTIPFVETAQPPDREPDVVADEIVVAVAGADAVVACRLDAAVVAQLDAMMLSLEAVGKEIGELRGSVGEISGEFDSRIKASTDTTEKTVSALSAKLDAIVASQVAIKAAVQPENPKKSKKELLADFYKTLNSPNSMFEYMFYICIVQIIFVIVNLFLVAYIVTLVRD